MDSYSEIQYPPLFRGVETGNDERRGEKAPHERRVGEAGLNEEAEGRRDGLRKQGLREYG